MTEGLPRPVSTKDALAYAGRLDDLCNAEWILKRLTDGANALRTLVSERDALASRVMELSHLLQIWSGDGQLQTFENRERFRKAARAALTTTSGDSHG